MGSPQPPLTTIPLKCEHSQFSETTKPSMQNTLPAHQMKQTSPLPTTPPNDTAHIGNPQNESPQMFADQLNAANSGFSSSPLSSQIQMNNTDNTSRPIDDDDDHYDADNNPANFFDTQTPPTTIDDAIATQTTCNLTNHLNEVEKQRGSLGSRSGHRGSEIVIRKFQKLDETLLSSTPAPDVKIGQRVAYKEYYGNEFGTIRWIGRVPQICPDWTVGVEFDNAIGEGDGSLNGRRYFIAKDCFAKFLPLNSVALVDQHVGRPEPGTMISVMSAAVRPGQMISIQRVSTVHVQHCFLNAPHQIPGADILAVNTRLHCQCPNCGPCAHVIKPPRTQRLARAGKNATHMCQFSTYTCCGMESQEETLCTYTGNKIASIQPPVSSSMAGLPPIGNSWIDGAGYLSNLQAQQTKLMPEEYKHGAAPEDALLGGGTRRNKSSRRGSGRQGGRHKKQSDNDYTSKDHQHSHRHHHHHYRKHHSKEGRSSSAQLTSDYANVNLFSSRQNGQQEVNLENLNSLNDAQFNNLSTPDVADPNLAVACPDKTLPDEGYNMYTTNTDFGPGKPKSPKVVYRNSIENRYLFPTDDSINSTLEADLENLSQARYGRHAHSRLSNSRNIFKSLCSLVPCLSVQSNNNSDFEKRYESTIEFTNNHSKGANQSMPAVDFSSTLSHGTVEFKKGEDDYSLPLYRKLSAETEKNLDREISTTIRHCDRIPRHQISSSSDCGFSSASQNSMNFYSHQTCSPILSNDEERRTIQIYKRIVARLMSSTSITNEDLYQLRKIIFNSPDCLSSCCLHQSPNQPFNSDEFDKIIADIIKKSSYLQSKNNEQTKLIQSATCETTSTAHITSSNEIKDKFSPISNNNDNLITNKDGISSINDKKNSNRSLLDEISTSESALSSYDSYCGMAETVGGRNQMVNSNSREDDKKNFPNGLKSTLDGAANLPKAFELKLTLSINSDSDNSSKLKNSNVKQMTGEDVVYTDGGMLQGGSQNVVAEVNSVSS